jgi:hypothetical protein
VLSSSTKIKQQKSASDYLGSTTLLTTFTIKDKDGNCAYMAFGLGNTMLLKFNTLSQQCTTLSHAKIWNCGPTHMPYGKNAIEDKPLVTFGLLHKGDIIVSVTGGYSTMLPKKHTIVVPVTYIKTKIAEKKGYENRTFTEEEQKNGVVFTVYKDTQLKEIIDSHQDPSHYSYISTIDAATLGAYIQQKHPEGIYDAVTLRKTLTGMVIEKAEAQRKIMAEKGDSTTNGCDCSIVAFDPAAWVKASTKRVVII